MLQHIKWRRDRSGLTEQHVVSQVYSLIQITTRMQHENLSMNSSRNSSVAKLHNIQYHQKLLLIARFKIDNQTNKRAKELTSGILEAMQQEWISKDKLRKLLGFFATVRLQQDLKAAENNPPLLIECPW